MRILPDGKILVHNLTPAMAALLSELDPADVLMRQRAGEPSETTESVSAANRDS